MTRPAFRTLLSVLVLAAGIAAAASAEPFDLKRELEGYRSLHLAKEGKTVSQRTVSLGHLKLEFDGGTAVPLVSPGGETLGFYFQGSGIYEYTVEDPVGAQVAAGNARDANALEIYRQGRFRDHFGRLLVFFARPTLEEVWSPTGDEDEGPAVPVPPGAEDGFRRIWKRIGESYLEYDHRAADARLNEGDGQYVYAEIEGDHKTVGYILDRLHSFWEGLCTFRNISGYDYRFRRFLSSQLVDGGPSAHPRCVILRDLDLDISTEDNRLATIRCGIELEFQRSAMRVVPLLLTNNRNPDSFDWRSEKNRLEVRKVTDAAGTELPFSHRYNEILVQLPEKAGPGDRVRLKFEMQGNILTGMDGTRHDNYFELFDANVYPEPFGWNSRDFHAHLRMRTRKPYRPVTSGRVVRFEEDGNSYLLEAEADDVKNLPAIFAGKYAVEEKSYGDLKVQVYGYGLASRRVLRTMCDLAHAIIVFYEKILGDYPYKQLRIIEVPEYGYGIAPTGTVLLTTEAYKARRDWRAEYFSRGINARLAHEIAHQWFGHVLAPETPRDNWVSESFAEYLSGLAMISLQGEKRRKWMVGFDQIFAYWRRNALASRDAGSIAGANLLSGSNAYRDRFYLLYCKGPLVLRTLHAMVGNERFYQILRTFLQGGTNGFGNTDDFRKACERVLHTDFGWFVHQWIEESGIPDVRVERRLDRAENGQPLLVGRVVQEDAPFKKLVIPVLVDYGGGRKEIKAIFQDKQESRFRIPLAARPKKVSVDPGQNVLAVFK